MKVLQYLGPKRLQFVELPKPEIQADEVLLKISKVGICGTDLHIYKDGMNLPTPLIMGHEFVGEIVEVGKEVKDLNVGQRAVAEHVVGCGTCIYCQQGKRNLCITPSVIGLHRPGALAEYLAIPANLVYTLPEAMTDDQGVLVEPLSIAVYAVRKAEIKVGDTVAVVGQGPIGLFVDQIANDAGSTVVGFDIHDDRLEYARSHKYIAQGINTTDEDWLSQFKQLSGVDSADVVFEAAGRDTTAEMSLELAKAGGQVMILGVFEHNVTINIMQIVKKELRVEGSWTCVFAFEPTINLLKSGKIDTEGLITHRYSFSDAIQAFEEASNHVGVRIKSVIEFDHKFRG